jgi:hypothetical protein
LEDKEKILGRVVGFLYDALDNFKTTMDDVTGSLSTLMSSLQKVEKDLQTLGVQPSKSRPIDSGQLAARIKAGSTSSSRERLISLLTGQPLTPTTAPAVPTFTSSATTTTKPTPPISVSGPPKATSGPPKAGPPVSGPPKAGPPVSGPPKSVSLPTKATPPIKTATPSADKPPTVMKPPVVPSIKPPPTSTNQPPIMKPPTPPMAAAAPTSAPAAGAKQTGSSIIGLRDEMLKELKRLKSIMKGGCLLK